MGVSLKGDVKDLCTEHLMETAVRRLILMLDDEVAAVDVAADIAADIIDANAFNLQCLEQYLRNCFCSKWDDNIADYVVNVVGICLQLQHTLSPRVLEYKAP